jgi:tetratricopeptide (TPR) repeat protein
MQGRFPEARRLLGEVQTAVERVGLAWAWPFTLLSWHVAELERLSGNLTAAERGLRLVYEQQRRAGDEGYLASTAVELADVLADQGHADEALQLTEISKAGAAPDDVAAQLVWRRVRARVLAPRGSVQEAKRLALEAVGIGERTDWLQGHADALLDLAGVLQLAGRSRDATDAARHALALYDQKGNLVLARKARRMVHELGRA